MPLPNRELDEDNHLCAIFDVEATMVERAEFMDWFDKLVHYNQEFVPSCFWRDVLRFNRRHIFKRYLKQAREEVGIYKR